MTQLASYRRPSASRLLARILDTPDLAEQVQALPPAILGRLISHVGVEDAGELVALATTEQLAQVFDDELWRSDRPGEDEHFDANRFVVWLEVMLEAGDSFVAQKLVELPEDLVTLALHRQVLVLNLEQLMNEMRDADQDADQTEKALSDCLYEELDEYQIVSRHHDGWDSVLAAILALDRDHHDHLVGILERCCKMSADYIEDNGGLYEVLTTEEMLEADVAAEREDRRAGDGHVSPSAAAAFLKLARTASETPATDHDPLTRAYLRGLAKRKESAQSARHDAGAPSPRRDLLRLLESTEMSDAPGAPRLPAGPSDDAGAGESLLMRAMERLSQEAPREFFARSEELAFLANVLGAGCSSQQRRLRPVEAVRAAIATCGLGLELVEKGRHQGDAVDAAVATLAAYPADGLFRRAWSCLDSGVIHPAAITTQHMLRAAAVRKRGAEAQMLTRLAERVRAMAAEGAAWKAIPELGRLHGTFEADEIATLSGFLDQCPTLTDDANEPRFISTTSDLVIVREHLALLARRR